jgi:HK97 family phage prohead protease
MNTRSFRALKGLEIREAAKYSGHIGVLTGYAAVFNSDSAEFAGYDKPWIERIAPGAFTRTLRDSPDVAALWSHRTDAILARTPTTLTLREDATGLSVEIALIDTQTNRDVLASVRGGLVDSMSFGFSTKSAKWDAGKYRDVRTLLDVDLFEVSPVVWPAYPGTSLSARSAVTVCNTPDEIRQITDERAAFFAEVQRLDTAARIALRGMALRFL